MFAQIFGLAEQVAKEFKDIYPDVIPDDYIDDFNFIYFVSYAGISSANTAKSRAESYDSGGGGFSSGGGGFGSFGGGGFGGGGGGGGTPPPMQSPPRDLWESGLQTDDDDETAYEYGW